MLDSSTNVGRFVLVAPHYSEFVWATERSRCAVSAWFFKHREHSIRLTACRARRSCHSRGPDLLDLISSIISPISVAMRRGASSLWSNSCQGTIRLLDILVLTALLSGRARRSPSGAQLVGSLGHSVISRAVSCGTPACCSPSMDRRSQWVNSAPYEGHSCE
jgi:hypothetical protein